MMYWWCLIIFFIIGLILLFYHESFESFIPTFLYRVGDIYEPNYPPRLISGFLSPEEVHLLIQESDRTGFDPSRIENNKENSNIRRSETCWLYPDKIPALQEIYDRVRQLPELTNEPDAYTFEPCQIVKYGPGGHYREHYDQCFDRQSYCINQMKDYGGPRKWTLIMYLTDDFDGGETYFNNLNQHVRAKAGDALLFHGLTMDNTRIHPASLHQGVPITRGEKRIANIWIHYTNIIIEDEKK